MNTEQQARAAFDARYPTPSQIHEALFIAFKEGWDARASAEQPATEQPKADEDGWITWAGDPCPLPDNSLVEVKRRNGAVEAEYARYLGGWYHSGSGADIIAYRISRGTAG